MSFFRRHTMQAIVKGIISPLLSMRFDLQGNRRNFKWLSYLILHPFGAQIEKRKYNGISALWVSTTESDPDKVVLYLHGGVFTMRLNRFHVDSAIRLAKSSSACVVIPDYRVAPEHPFPAAIDDCASCYLALLDEGFLPQKIAFAGDSAGANLVLTVMLYLKENGHSMPSSSVCLSPITDATFLYETLRDDLLNDPLITMPWLKFLVSQYIGSENPRIPLISPLFGDLEGLAPLLIQVGENEVLLIDAKCMAEQYKAAGNEVTLDVWKHMWHNWHFLATYLPEAEKALEKSGLFIRKHMEMKYDVTI